MIALTYDLLAYTWGDGKKGQLGHGIKENWRSKPACVEALKGKNISRVCAGDGFSVFASDNGIVMTCGDGALGCLGRGDWNCCTKPQLIERLLSVDVSAINCGPQHVVVVTGEGGAFAWGCGSGGRLGTGTEEDCCTPTEVQLSDHVMIQQVFCGLDGTMFITESRGALACGRNDYNKLGLNERRGFLMQMKQLMVKTEVEKCLTPKRLRWLQSRVVSVSMGASHTAMLVESGKVITMGCNREGQLGRGNARNHTTPMLLKSMMNKTVTMIQCGGTFTVAGTAENVVYFWGGRRISSSPFRPILDANSLKDPVMQSVKTFDLKPKPKKSVQIDDDEPSLISETSVSDVIKIGENNSPLMREVERIGPDSPIIQVKTPETKLMSSNASSVFSNKSSDRDSPDRNSPDFTPDKKNLVLNPEEILALYASPTQIARGEIVRLSNVYCYGNQLYLAVDTTAPLPQSQKKKKAATKPKTVKTSKPPDVNLGSSVEDFLNDSSPCRKTSLQTSAPCSLESSQVDSMGPIPQWLKEELEDALIPGAAPEEDMASKEANIKGLASIEVSQNVNDTGKGAGLSKLSSRTKLSSLPTIQQPAPSTKPRKTSLIPVRCSKITTVSLSPPLHQTRPHSSANKHETSCRPKSAVCRQHKYRPTLSSLTQSYPERRYKSAHPTLVKGRCVSSSSPDILCCEPSYPKRPESSSISDAHYGAKRVANHLCCGCSMHEYVDNSVSTQASSCESIVTCIPTNPVKARELELENKIKEMDEKNKQKEIELMALQQEFERQAQQIKEIENKAFQQAKEKEAFEAEVAKVREELSKKNQAFQDCQRQLQRLQDQIQDLKQNAARSPEWISEPLPSRKRKTKSKICSIQ